MGDPAGIGPAITVKALEKLKGVAHFIVVGDAWVFNQNQKPETRNQRPETKINKYDFIDLDNVRHKGFKFGEVRAENGRASMEYLDKALELIRKGEADCLVTCPISKEAIYRGGYKYSGHTEFLAQRTHSRGLVMMLLNRYLKFSLLTRHIPLSRVSPQLNGKKLYKTILTTHDSLKRMFRIKDPRIAVCGLNPHASDNGIIGAEENNIIKPVVRKLENKIKNCIGPLPADVAVSRAYGGLFDAVIALYHDQALIPLKLTSKNSGVNLTLGLPFIRTSPLHGTAFDIAKNPALADPASLIEAIRLSVRCTLNLKKD